MGFLLGDFHGLQGSLLALEVNQVCGDHVPIVWLVWEGHSCLYSHVFVAIDYVDLLLVIGSIRHSFLCNNKYQLVEYFYNFSGKTKEIHNCYDVDPSNCFVGFLGQNCTINRLFMGDI